MIDTSWDQVVSAAVIEKPVELHVEAPVGAQRRRARPAGIELQFDRRADRTVACDLAGEKAAAEARAAEQVLLARRQDVAAVLAADRDLQRRLNVADRDEALHPGKFAGHLREIDDVAGPRRQHAA